MEVLRSLSAKATITAASLSVEICTLMEWESRVQSGSLIDVFTSEGLSGLRSQLDDATAYLDARITELENKVPPKDGA